MSINKNLGMLLLAIWLILVGISAFVDLGNLSTILAVLALIAGILILIDRRSI